MLIQIILTIGAIVMVAPFIWQTLVSLKTYAESIAMPPSLLPATPQWSNFATVFDKMPFWQQLGNTVVMSGGRVLGQVIVCTLAAYAFARLSFPFRDVLFALFLSVMMVPAQLLLLPQYEIVRDLGWLDTPYALIIPGVFSAFGTFLLRQFFLSIPIEIEEAAKLDGANPLRVLWSIMLPLVKPGVVAMSIMTLLGSWNDFLWPLIVTSQKDAMPLSVGLASLVASEHSKDFTTIMAGSLMVSLPMMIIFLLFQRHFIEGISLSAGKE